MPYCDLCGKETKVLYRVIIEGSEMLVCEECAKLGRTLGKIDYRRPPKRTLSQRLEDAGRDVTEEDLIVEDFGERIKRAREKLGLTREDRRKRAQVQAHLLAQHEETEPGMMGHGRDLLGSGRMAIDMVAADGNVVGEPPRGGKANRCSCNPGGGRRGHAQPFGKEATHDIDVDVLSTRCRQRATEHGEPHGQPGPQPPQPSNEGEG